MEKINDGVQTPARGDISRRRGLWHRCLSHAMAQGAAAKTQLAEPLVHEVSVPAAIAGRPGLSTPRARSAESAALDRSSTARGPSPQKRVSRYLALDSPTGSTAHAPTPASTATSSAPLPRARRRSERVCYKPPPEQTASCTQSHAPAAQHLRRETDDDRLASPSHLQLTNSPATPRARAYRAFTSCYGLDRPFATSCYAHSSQNARKLAPRPRDRTSSQAAQVRSWRPWRRRKVGRHRGYREHQAGADNQKLACTHCATRAITAIQR